MGLAPSGNDANPGKSAVAKVPVPILSQPRSVVTFWTGLLLAAGSAMAAEIRLDQLDLSTIASAWNSVGVNLSIERRPITVGGRRFAYGVGVHPPSRIAVETHGTATRFLATVGVDDQVGPDSGTVEFRIYGDGRLLWKSGLVRGSDPGMNIDVNVRGVERVELIVTTAGRYSSAHRDHATWANARFEYQGRPPRTEKYPAEYPEVDEAGARIEAIRRELTAFSQDAARREYWQRIRSQVMHPAALITADDRDPLDVLLRRTAALIEQLQRMIPPENSPLPPLQAQFVRLQDEAKRTAVEKPQLRDQLCRRLLALRRRIALTNPLLDFKDILFIQRYPLPGHDAAGHNICDQYFGFHAVRGGGLFVLENAFDEKSPPRLRNVLEPSVCENGRWAGTPLSGGAFLSPELSFDGRTILFAWTEALPYRYRWHERTTYSIFRVGTDGSSLRQLTDGPFNDFDPCWLPNGRIAFISERRGGFGRCFGRPVPAYTLHTMLDDGHDLTRISPHETNEWQPSVDHDGRILYTRWDYVDRGDIQAHHPWVITPDGRDPRAVHGNYRRSPETSPNSIMDLRAIPGSTKYLGTAAPHHGQAYGSLVVIDPSVVDDDAMSQVKRFTPEVPLPQSEDGGPVYATAWPLDEHFCLCVYDDRASTVHAVRSNYGIYLVDAFGNRELIYRDRRVPCLSPIPLQPRRRPLEMPHYTSFGHPRQQGGFQPLTSARPTAPVMLMNVYDSTYPLPPGETIAALRVVQLLPKTTPSANQPWIGYGSQKSARRVLGTVPVAEDGSAFFNVPVDVPIYFQALDARGRAVQSMRSDTHAFSCRGLSCQGCHEPRHRTPDYAAEGFPLALQNRQAAAIEPDVLGSNPFSYPLLVQPVLDQYCVQCHGGGPGHAAPDLRRGDPAKHPRRWFTSYENLEKYAFFYADQTFTAPRTVPGEFGARASRLMKLLDEGHEGVELPDEALYRLSLWLDCNSDFFGAYDNIEAQSAGRIVLPTLE
jgi:hypothetical protein